MRNRYATLWIAALIILVFLAQNLFGLNLAWPVGTVDVRFFLSIVAHGSTSHLLGNLFGLVVFGLMLEEIVGTKRYLNILLLAGIVGNLAGIGSYTAVIGISGAIYGIFGALAVLRPKMVVWVSGMPMPMVLAAVGWAFVDFIGLFANTQTGHLAHLAGIVVGIAYGFSLRKEVGPPPKQSRRRKRRMSPTEKNRIDRQLDQFEEEHMT